MRNKLINTEIKIRGNIERLDSILQLKDSNGLDILKEWQIPGGPKNYWSVKYMVVKKVKVVKNIGCMMR